MNVFKAVDLSIFHNIPKRSTDSLYFVELTGVFNQVVDAFKVDLKRAVP